MHNSASTSPDASYIRVAKRGKHKIFIGMSPGVGKTYRMLEEGHRLRQEGLDVVIGLLETHNRQETAQKSEGLELIPRKQITHSDVTLTEMDTDAILARQPQLALIDELAHTNVPGSEQEKRHQDVERILDAGIDNHYPAVGAALLQIFEQYLKEDWTRDVQPAWTDTFEAIAQIMLEGAEE